MASSRQGGENERRTGWAILRLQPGPAAWIFFVLLPDLGSCFVLVLAFGGLGRARHPLAVTCAHAII